MFVEALISECHSVGIKLIILMRKDLFSGFVSEEKSHEKSPQNLSLPCLFCAWIFVVTKKFVVPGNFINNFLVTTWSLAGKLILNLEV